jgi:o-succinylbenzoate synthase
LKAYPALRFALETALFDLKTGGQKQLFPSDFTAGKAAIPINGLIWMGDFDFMWHQAEKKFKEGFSVLKMKVGALDFDEEMYFISQLRKYFPEVELRLDANGGFPVDEALERLQALNQFKIHSIEQPIKQHNISKMAELCKKSPIAIALDEELIGIHRLAEKTELLRAVQPQYIILKPSLLGGFQACDEWIAEVEKLNIAWWATSALEANIGLNAIAQWTFTKGNPMPQGLGTGSLYENNIASPLVVKEGSLTYDISKQWADI